MIVATVLTVYGIETNVMAKKTKKKFSGKLQQYLPFTVLKLFTSPKGRNKLQLKLQQYLPFTVLKHKERHAGQPA